MGGGKLHRRAPEHIRPVSSAEARQVPEESMESNSPTVTARVIEPLPDENGPENNPMSPEVNITPNNSPSEDNSSQSQEQPGHEPEENNPSNEDNDHVNTPIQEHSHLLCCEDEIMTVSPEETPCA